MIARNSSKFLKQIINLNNYYWYGKGIHDDDLHTFFVIYN
ncbi:hypothetical protein JCM30566_08280 [Marinitoga arctica]